VPAGRRQISESGRTVGPPDWEIGKEFKSPAALRKQLPDSMLLKPVFPGEMYENQRFLLCVSILERPLSHPSFHYVVQSVGKTPRTLGEIRVSLTSRAKSLS
jgi:hypothetical protein